jgi:hypothetical protein
MIEQFPKPPVREYPKEADMGKEGNDNATNP